MQSQDYGILMQKLDLKFENVSDLRSAFIHRSYLNESREKESNERLEFLGDAVLELVTTEFLYNHFPNKPEGELTAIRAALVRKENLAVTARKLNLGKYLLLSRGEESSGGRDKDYILANTVEALIGTIYLHLKIAKAAKFIYKHILPAIEAIMTQKLYIDSKSYFQELAQAKRNITPVYKLLSDEGPDHAKVFKMGAYLNDELVGEGTGGSKQIAEGDAAGDAIKRLGWI
ncbi:MAG: ribonuclease III [Patescibacteria group bacterium]|nr:ribonuclease III [Patescibacteria group bacterium]